MVRLTQWLFPRLGTPIDYDGYYGDQCVDAVNSWLEFSGDPARAKSPTATGIAHELWANWQWVPNAAYNFPSPGDVVVWRPYVETHSIGPSGHTSICLLADGHALLSADQNWGGIARIECWMHDYVGVLGWQHHMKPW